MSRDLETRFGRQARARSFRAPWQRHVLLLLASVVWQGQARADGRSALERSLLQSFFSPCCYRETLDTHVSPLADELRMDIHARLLRGETAEAITQAMIARYGDRVTTQPPSDFASLAWMGGAGAVVTAGLFLALRRGRGPARKEAAAAVWDDGELADRLADDLARLD